MIYFEIREKASGKILIENMGSFDCPVELRGNKNQTIRRKKIKSRYKEFDLVTVWLIAENN